MPIRFTDFFLSGTYNEIIISRAITTKYNKGLRQISVDYTLSIVLTPRFTLLTRNIFNDNFIKAHSERNVYRITEDALPCGRVNWVNWLYVYVYMYAITFQRNGYCVFVYNPLSTKSTRFYLEQYYTTCKILHTLT